MAEIILGPASTFECDRSCGDRADLTTDSRCYFKIKYRFNDFMGT